MKKQEASPVIGRFLRIPGFTAADTKKPKHIDEQTPGKKINGRTVRQVADPRVAADILAYALAQFPESYAAEALEKRIRTQIASSTRPLLPFLSGFTLLEREFEQSVPGGSAKKIREAVFRAFSSYEGVEPYWLLLKDEKFQLIILQEEVVARLGKELLQAVGVRRLQSLIAHITEDTIIKGITVVNNEVYFDDAQRTFLKLPPEWLRLVSSALGVLTTALFNELAKKADKDAAHYVLRVCVEELGEALHERASYHALLRLLPAGALSADFLQTMSRAELEKEVRERTAEGVRKTRELQRLVSENSQLAAFPLNSPNPILGIDADGRIEYANAAAKSLQAALGLSSLENLLPSAHHSYLSECLASDSIRRAEVTFGDRTYEWTYAPFKEAQSVHLYATDITSKKRLETLLAEAHTAAKMLIRKDQEAMEANQSLMALNNELSSIGRELVRRDLALTEANTRLMELDQVKSEFVSVAAHQLRTPLTGIRWTLHALANKELGDISPQQEMFIRTALKTVIGTVSLINDLLNVARMEEGRFGFNFKSADVVAIVRRSILRYTTFASEKGVKLTTSIDASPPALKLDEEKIEMAVDNLIDNAIKYTESGGSVAIGLTADEKRVRITVSDTGVGIPSTEHHKLFDKFFRAHNAQLLHTAGTGLGLYIVRNIIERHNGTIDFESTEGKGTTFTIEIPINRK